MTYINVMNKVVKYCTIGLCVDFVDIGSLECNCFWLLWVGNLNKIPYSNN
jgi:hypothetical protein